MKKILKKEYDDKINKSAKSDNNKDKVDSFDDVIVKKNNFNFDDDISKKSEEIKKDFLKKKEKANELIPNNRKKLDEVRDKLGYFKTEFGAISVGFNKFKKNSPLGFSILPKDSKFYKSKYAKKDFKDKSNYFKKNFNKNEKKMEFSDVSFKYDLKENKIEKLDINDNFKKTSHDFLYNNNDENEVIKKLMIKRKDDIFKNSKIQDSINDFENIKNEKKDDNDKFYNEIKKFIKMFKNNKLKKYEASDDLKKNKDRISREYFKTEYDFIFLKKRLEEILKSDVKNKVILIKELIFNSNLNSKNLSRILSYIKNNINNK